LWFVEQDDFDELDWGEEIEELEVFDEEDGVDSSGGGEALTTALPPAIEAWRKRSISGALLTATAFGLGEVFDPRKDEPAIVMQAMGEPPGPPQPVELQLDPDDPAGSRIVVRPWLIDDEG
jgi:hypothetical protein